MDAKAARAASIALNNETWPYNVQEFVEDIPDGLVDDQLISQDIRKADSYSEAEELYAGYGSGNARRSAEKLRQRLGLPPVGS